MLLLPPIGAIALLDANVFGLPLPLVYVFTVWALLIGAAALLARPLQDRSDASEPVPDSPRQAD